MFLGNEITRLVHGMFFGYFKHGENLCWLCFDMNEKLITSFAEQECLNSLLKQEKKVFTLVEVI